MSGKKDDTVRKRIWSEIIRKEAGLENETDLAGRLGRTEHYDRSNARKAMQGTIGISPRFLDAIEEEFGFRRRHYVETGKWPNDETQAEQIAKLPKEEFQALLDLASSPGVRDFLLEIKKSSKEDLDFFQDLFRTDPALTISFLKAMSKSEKAPDEEAEVARIRKIAKQVRDKHAGRKKKGS